ncbi:lymphocyte antigen 75-like [Clavelina lepadiformis]|uniref:lymphocyte antigen 75-like n=1 Tax=Clavelina lepadiformis TaxID=159417 RepID=UPI00404142F2
MPSILHLFTIAMLFNHGLGQKRVSMYGDMVYTFSHFNQNQAKASNLCKTHYNGKLATIPDANIQMHLENQLQDIYSTSDYWIGLKHMNDSEWKWSNMEKPNYTNWQDHNGDNKCAAISRTGSWKSIRCNASLPYACEIPLASMPVNNKTMAKYIFTEVKLRYQEAAAVCAARGMKLAPIETPEQQQLINHATFTNDTMRNYYFEKPNQNESDNNTAGFSNWAPGFSQPILDTMCTYLAIGKNETGQWKTGQCFVQRRFICILEVDAMKTQTMSTWTTEKMDVTDEMMSPSTLNTTLAGKGKPEDYKMESTTEGGNSANIIKMTTYMAMVAFIACLMHVV